MKCRARYSQHLNFPVSILVAPLPRELTFRTEVGVCSVVSIPYIEDGVNTVQSGEMYYTQKGVQDLRHKRILEQKRALAS